MYTNMDFSSWDNTTVTLPLIDCSPEFTHGILLGFNVSLILLILSRMFNWCSDPLATRLAEKVAELEEENKRLLVQIEDMNDEIDERQTTLDNLRDVLRIKRDLESDDESVSAPKRRRVA